MIYRCDHRCGFGLSVRFLLALVLLTMVQAGWAIPAGMVHHWNFDEGPDWHDDPFGSVCAVTQVWDSVSGDLATLVDMGSGNWVSGEQFSGLEFDGVSNYVSVAGDLSNPLGRSASLVFWIRTIQTGGVSGRVSPGVVGVTAGTADVQWGWIDQDGRMALSVGGTLVVRSGKAINDGQWHHIAITRNHESGAAQLYVDGKMSDSAVGPAGIITSAFNSLGRIENTNGVSGYYQGRLDQVYVFDRVIDGGMVGQLMDNHAPKAWDTLTQGTNDQAFATESIFFKTYDSERDALGVVGFSQAEHGVVTDNGDGTFTYAADGGFTGDDRFVVTIEDGRGGFSRATMNLKILAAPDADASNRTTSFVDFQALQAGGSDLVLSGSRTPRVLDWDGDGDQDLLVSHGGKVWLYVNNGTASSVVLAAGVRVTAGGQTISLGSGMLTMALADMTGDGIKDLILVDSSRKIRVYRNTAASGAVPVFAASSFVKTPAGSDFVLPDQRFDAGDWDGDGLSDIVTGAWSGEMRAYRNVGTAVSPRFDSGIYEVLTSSSYNLYPRLFDLTRNGVIDFVRGINWGSITYWFDPQLHDDLGPSGNLSIVDGDGVSPDLHALTDGAVVDFADFNDDGVYDIIMGGYASDRIYLAYGQAKTVADCLAENEAIYDANLTNLGPALEANNQELLNRVNANSRAIISHMQAATLPERQLMFDQMAAHVGRYSFLQMNAPLDTVAYHHVPSIAGQNLLTMHQMLPDSPSHRLKVANAVGLAGLHRTIYLESALHVGDNQNATQGMLESIRDFMRYEPRIKHPDTMLTLNHYRGDGRGGHVNSFTGAKNTFDFGIGNDADEWAGDLDVAIQTVFGTNAHRGDYFTLVMGHEATHSLDGYVNSRANKDLRRRWGQFLVLAGGPDIVAGSDGWYDWTATKAHFKAVGLWDEAGQTWDEAWDAYWSTGPGSAWKDLSFMRGNIGWFYGAPQESLATQGNHQWMHAEGRLVGAIDRWRRGVENHIPAMKANITEVVTFLDYLSAGLNKIVLCDTHGIPSPYPHAEYHITLAWLERNDRGYITRVKTGDHDYRFTLDENGIVVDVTTNIITAHNDLGVTGRNQALVIDVTGNDTTLEGGARLLVNDFSEPSHGRLYNNGDGRLIYVPDVNFTGQDSFDYVASGRAEGAVAGAVHVNVFSISQGAIKERYLNLGSSTSISALTGSAKFGYDPDTIGIIFSFEGDTNYAEGYGARIRGWLIPPVTGDYQFWIATDDNGELWFSLDGQPGHAALIASVPGWAGSRDWDKFSEQTSPKLTLQAGKQYYIEALMKEGNGGDNFAVAWQGPGITRQVISGAYLRPYYQSGVSFEADPMMAQAVEGRIYQESLTGRAVANETVEYALLAGPDWLTVADDDTLSGMPGDSDVGQNDFVIRAMDSQGDLAIAALQVVVVNMFTGERGLADLLGLVENWLDADCGLCRGADLSGDGWVSFDDFSWLSLNFR